MLEPRDYECVSWAEEDEDMASVTVGVEGRRSVVRCRGEMSQSPRFSASWIGLRSLGFVGALWARRTLVPVPRLAPLLLWCCARGAHYHTRQAPLIRARIDRFPDLEIWRSLS
jgi:hypothetical protein